MHAGGKAFRIAERAPARDRVVPTTRRSAVVAQKVWDDKSLLNVDFSLICSNYSLQDINSLEKQASGLRYGLPTPDAHSTPPAQHL